MFHSHQHLLRCQRQLENPNACRARNGVGNRRHHWRDRGLADAVQFTRARLLQDRDGDPTWHSVMSRPDAPLTPTFPSRASRSSGEASSCSAASSNSCRFTSLTARPTAEPIENVVRLELVCCSYGVLSVSGSETETCSSG